MKKFLAILFLAFLFVASINAQANCPPNEHFMCGTPCQKSCETIKGIRPPPEVCNQDCKKGCFCKRGLVRRNNNAFSDCIPKDQCPQ
ncbi:unnamed protein product [Larinioides sclopetarius]|uniref:TIL domain-containing protein n=1 Tax=Larinioides sclopetarius TaxID=280406 RepID=A0AAV1YUD0_9ARAC